MTGPVPSIEEGTVETRGNTRVLHYLLRLPQPVDKVWTAVATAEGLRGWLAEAEVFEPRLNGRVTLHGLGTGRVTAWDVERVAEYSVEGWGRIRFHLEPARPAGTTIRFTHESAADRSATAGDQGWRERFEHLVAHLQPPRGGAPLQGHGAVT